MPGLNWHAISEKRREKARENCCGEKIQSVQVGGTFLMIEDSVIREMNRTKWRKKWNPRNPPLSRADKNRGKTSKTTVVHET